VLLVVATNPSILRLKVPLRTDEDADRAAAASTNAEPTPRPLPAT
jgi:hypothetical protein